MSYPGAEYDDIAREYLRPSNHQNPAPRPRYHLVVVGAGPAGLITSIGAAGLGANVALIERHRMGGDCLNVGCVPSKALLEFTGQQPDASFADAFAWLRRVRAGIAPHDSVARYTDAGVDVFLGAAAFDPQGRICVDGMPLNARRVALCTGARAELPPIPGLVESEPLTNETVFDLISPPASMAILGAGAIGCELALAFARLGVKIDLFELADRVLPLEVADASARVAAALQSAGVILHLGQRVSAVSKGAGGDYSITAGAHVVVSERLLVALGRRPNSDELCLGNAGVQVDGRGFIVTDNKLRTSNHKIFAAGDCTGGLQFTHHADAQARAVVQNALFAPTAKIDRLVVPHCTYTKPEVASVGANEADLNAAGIAFDVYEFAFEELDRGRAELNGDGFARVWTRQGTDQIVGATIVGHDAGEQIAPICMLMSNGQGLRAAGKALFCYPTRSEYLKRLADAYNRSRFTPRVAALFGKWLRFTG